MQYAYMNIRVYIEDHIVELVGNDDMLSPGDGYVNAPNFKIIAKHLGITTLYVSSLFNLYIYISLHHISTGAFGIM